MADNFIRLSIEPIRRRLTALELVGRGSKTSFVDGKFFENSLYKRVSRDSPVLYNGVPSKPGQEILRLKDQPGELQ